MSREILGRRQISGHKGDTGVLLVQMIDEPEQPNGSFVLTDAQCGAPTRDGLRHFAVRTRALDMRADATVGQPLECFIVLWRKQDAHPS